VEREKVRFGECAPTLPGVDPARLAVWGFSLSGGHVLPVAARHPRLAAAVAQTPLVDGPAASRAAARYQGPIGLLRRALFNQLVPLAAAPGTVALLNTPDAIDADRALNPGNRYPEWRQEIAARSALRIGFYRPARYASRVGCPLLVLVCDDDRSALAGPAVRVARRAPAAELVRIPGGHYEPFLDGHEPAVEAELSFLRRHLLPAPDRQGRSMSA
jgi:pimeloyl-ACP methyl ester carboxylesterase